MKVTPPEGRVGAVDEGGGVFPKRTLLDLGLRQCAIRPAIVGPLGA